MQPNDTVLYTITVTGIDPINMPIVAQKLGYQDKQVEASGTIRIERVYTRWRGDAAETAWQNDLRTIIGKAGTVAFAVRPWTHAPGYPKGETI